MRRKRLPNTLLVVVLTFGVLVLVAAGFGIYAVSTPDALAFFPTATPGPQTQTAIASVTNDAGTRIVIAAHQKQFPSPVPVSDLETPEAVPTPNPTPTAQPSPTPANALTAAAPTQIPTATATPLPPGTVQDEDFYSNALGRSLPYRIYLPPNYANTTTRYPVLYMLHGASGSYKEWTDYGLLSRTDETIRAGQNPPFIIVLPMGELGYFVNHANGGPRWGDYITQDVVGQIDSHYRTIANAGNRAIGGLSMGGYGALQIAFNHPDEFSIVGADSPNLRTLEVGAADWGTDPAYYAQVDPISLAKTKDLSGLKIWIDIGKDDAFLPRVQLLHDALQSRNIPHTWNVWPGAHEKVYWASHVLDYASFYAHAFTYKS